MGHKSNLPSPSIKFEAQPRPNYGDMVWHIVKSENHEVRSNLYISIGWREISPTL